MTKRQLRKQLKEFSHKTEPSTTLYSGALGIYIGGHQYVDVPNRPGFVYVRLRNNTSELIQAHNEVVSPVYGLPVILVRNKTYYEIYGRDSVQYASYWDSSSSYLPKHGHQHEFDPDNNGGGDLVFVHGEQFYPMMTFPSGTDGGNTVLIAPYRYYYSSAWHYAGDTGAGNLLQYGPTGASNAKLLLVGIDATTGNPFVKLGSEFDASITGAAAMTSYVPTNITQSTDIPGAIVRLVTGTATITWANIYDARQYMGILQAGGGATDFLGLSDTPNSYSGQADKLVVVNSAANALEFRTNTGSFGGGGGGTGTYFDGIQETFFPTLNVSDYTGSYYYLDFIPSDGTELDSATLGVGNNQFAFAWITQNAYDLKNWLLRGQYTFFMFLDRSAGSHPMTVYCKLYEEYSGSEYEIAVSDIATSANSSTAIPTGYTDGFAFRMKLKNDLAPGWDGPTYEVDTISRLLIKVFVNVGAGGSDGILSCYPDKFSYFNVNLQRQVLDNHYVTLTGTSSGGGGGSGLGFYGRDEGVGLGTGTTLNVVGSDISLSISGTVLTLLHSDPTGTPHSFLDLTDTPDSYSGQGSKYVAVKSDASGLEFVTAPAGGGGGSNLVIYDDGVYKATGTSISFDANLTVIASGSSVFVAGAAGGGGGGGSGVVVYDDSVYKVTGTSISFDGNLSVAVTGSTAFISSSIQSSGLILLEQQSANNSSSLNFTGTISSLYDTYKIEFIDIVSTSGSSTNTFALRYATTGTYDANSNYRYVGWYMGNADALTKLDSAGDTSLKIDQSTSTANNRAINGWMELYNPGNSRHKHSISNVVSPVSTASIYMWQLGGVYQVTAPVTAFQFLFLVDKIASGTIRVYGISKS